MGKPRLATLAQLWGFMALCELVQFDFMGTERPEKQIVKAFITDSRPGQNAELQRPSEHGRTAGVEAFFVIGGSQHCRCVSGISAG